MTKIYVVKGKFHDDTDSYIVNVFTNYRKAIIFAEYMNLTFEKEGTYWIRSYTIDTSDYKSLLNLAKKRGQ